MDVHGWVCILLFHHCTLTSFPVLRVCDILGASPWLKKLWPSSATSFGPEWKRWSSLITQCFPDCELFRVC